METCFLIISALLFVLTFGIYMILNSGSPVDKPKYTRGPLMSAIPWICGFVLPVIPFTLVFDYHWVIIFFLNLVFVFMLGPKLTEGFLVRFASGKGFGRDMLYSFIGGVVTLVIGLIV